MLASTECQNFLFAWFAWFSSSFVEAEWNQAQAKPTGLVPTLSLVWWHCGGFVRLELLSIGHFLQEKAWDVLVHELPKFNGIDAKQGQLMTSGLSPCLFCAQGHRHTQVWNTARRQRPPRKENPQLNLKIFWNYCIILMCLGTWLRKITFFSSDARYAESANCWLLYHISIYLLTFC